MAGTREWYLKNRASILIQRKLSRDSMTADQKEKRRTYMASYSLKNKERISHERKNKYAENPAPARERARIRAQENAQENMVRAKNWRKAHPEEAHRINRSYYQKHKPKILMMSSLRTRRRKQAMPRWADKAEIEAIYAEAQKKTQETGVSHHVDHIMPLIGKKLSGLHVPWNLQILTAQENWSKGNRIWPA